MNVKERNGLGHWSWTRVLGKQRKEMEMERAREKEREREKEKKKERMRSARSGCGGIYALDVRRFFHS